MKHKLPADVSRCNGTIQVGDDMITCPQRDNCLRYLDRQSEHPWMSFILVTGSDKVGNCDSIIERIDD